MLSVAVDTAKINKLKDKFSKYGPYAINSGLKAMQYEMNQSPFKRKIYPPNRNGSPFVWSSERQRRFVYANVDLPYTRTYQMADYGQFNVNKNYFTIEYQNFKPEWIYVFHPSYQIIGHRLRGWTTINRFIVSQSGSLVKVFKPAAIQAWSDMDSFIMGSGGGL